MTNEKILKTLDDINKNLEAKTGEEIFDIFYEKSKTFRKMVKSLDEEKDINCVTNGNPIEKILELKSQIVKLNEHARSICKNYTGEKNYKHQNCKHHWDCSDCINWEI